MAGSKDSASRLGLSLHARDGRKYDQVIALTQGNINESLQYYYDINSEALKFDVKVKGAIRAQLQGEILAPTVELIDEDNNDKALYCLTFDRGSKYITFVQEDPEDDNSRYVPQSQDASGWKLAFEVNFGLSKLTSVPENIREQINKPGDYSVSQLIVIFGTADTLTFNWERSTIKLKGNDAIADARTAFKLFVDRWLTATKMRDEPAKHNVLGYAVTTPDPTAIELAAPSFPPTSVRLQTINHRPNGDASQGSTGSDFNAFLFTEMCGNREMITSDLPWSGDFFYESIGGTLLMSKSIFFDDYISKALAPINIMGKRAANEMALRLIGDRLGPWAISDNESDADNNEFQVDGKNLRHSWDRRRSHPWQESRILTMTAHFHTEVSTHVWMLNSNSFIFRRWLKFESTIEGNVVDPIFQKYSAGTLRLSMTATCTADSIFTMSSVEATGKLDIDVENKAPVIDAQVQPNHDGPVPSALSAVGLGDLLNIGADDVKSKIRGALESTARDSAEVGNSLQEAVNNQGKFVFPGGGTFDMKDPLFTNDGDLIMGLVYRK
ncbi:hypothetical protein AMS68_007588 [Peltaster fructicola]|uniref:Uncharacterized protein n=1 Tax=Peltaster fructicola TaxID=286661 RepID=A0A6H0Y575_9PEZI|nr:hypothetical protein AMS68_007588 [Peltaster fructicola]